MALTDAVRTLTYVFVLANIDPKKSKPKPPEQSPTPDEQTKKKQAKPGSFAFIAKAKLAALKKRKEGGG